jgi:hypothetical protein
MTKKMPFTEASIARRIRGVKKAGWHPIGVTSDGTVLIGDKPLETSSLIPIHGHDDPASKWEDQRG